MVVADIDDEAGAATVGLIEASGGRGLYIHADVADRAQVAVTGVFLYASLGIRINAICPGTARSQMVDAWIGSDAEKEAQVTALHPIGRIAGAGEIAEAAVWLCSSAASFVVGHALSVDGGYVVQ